LQINVRATLLSLLLFFGFPAFPQGFSVEQIMSGPFTNGLAVAPKAGTVAWVMNIRGASNVWFAAAPDFAAHHLTRYEEDDGQPIASLRLTPDGHIAVYARGTELNHDGHAANPLGLTVPPKQQVWAVDVNGGEPRLLGDMGCEMEGCEDIQISPDGQYAVWEGKHQLWIAPVSGSNSPAKQLTDILGHVADPRWSPDGQHLLFVVDRESHSLIAIGDVNGEQLAGAFATTPSPTALGDKKALPPLLKAVHYVQPSTERDLDPRWSADGMQIVFIRTAGVENKLPLIPLRPQPWSLWVGDASNYAASQIWHSGNNLRDSLPRFAGPSLYFAGDRIVFVSEQTNRNHLYSIPKTGGQATELTRGDFDVEDVSLTPNRQTVLFSSNQDDVDRRHIWRVSVAGEAPQTALTKGETIEWAPITTGDGRTVLCLGSSATSTAMPYRITATGREMLAREAIPSDFPGNQLVVPKQVILRSSDGVEVHGQLFVPRHQSGRGPALIFSHGGPIRQMMLGFHYMGYYHNAYAENQYLASQGYTVLSVNYRLSIMYGYDFAHPANASWRGASEYNDILAAAKYLQSLPNVDPGRIGLWGGSYGGYLTAMGLARNSDLFKAGVDYHGVHDWSVRLARFQSGTFPPPDEKEAEKLAWESSPDSVVPQWRSPVLLIHGDDDRNVAFNQSTDLVQRLKAQGVHYEEIVLPDEIHELLLWRDWVRTYKATAEFFSRNLQ
jgi:dipeptidyl aminopeptidase/acylaminoacyl peptidase